RCSPCAGGSNPRHCSAECSARGQPGKARRRTTLVFAEIPQDSQAILHLGGRTGKAGRPQEEEIMTRKQTEASAETTVLTPRQAAGRLQVSNSWLAKARMRGDGPPYFKIGRSIRYAESTLQQWMKSRQRLSTSQQ